MMFLELWTLLHVLHVRNHVKVAHEFMAIFLVPRLAPFQSWPMLSFPLPSRSLSSLDYWSRSLFQKSSSLYTSYAGSSYGCAL